MARKKTQHQSWSVDRLGPQRDLSPKALGFGVQPPPGCPSPPAAGAWLPPCSPHPGRVLGMSPPAPTWPVQCSACVHHAWARCVAGVPVWEANRPFRSLAGCLLRPSHPCARPAVPVPSHNVGIGTSRRWSFTKLQEYYAVSWGGYTVSRGARGPLGGFSLILTVARGARGARPPRGPREGSQW